MVLPSRCNTALCLSLVLIYVTKTRKHSVTTVTSMAFICLFRGSAYACLNTFYSSRSWCSDVLQFIAFLLYICMSVMHHMIHFIFQDVHIDICAILNDTTGTLMSCAWKDFNCRIGVIVGMWTVGKFELTVCLMHLDCLLMHEFPCSMNVRFNNMSVAFKLFYCLSSSGGLFYCVRVMGIFLVCSFGYHIS